MPQRSADTSLQVPELEGHEIRASQGPDSGLTKLRCGPKEVSAWLGDSDRREVGATSVYGDCGAAGEECPACPAFGVSKSGRFRGKTRAFTLWPTMATRALQSRQAPRRSGRAIIAAQVAVIRAGLGVVVWWNPGPDLCQAKFRRPRQRGGRDERPAGTQRSPSVATLIPLHQYDRHSGDSYVAGRSHPPTATDLRWGGDLSLLSRTPGRWCSSETQLYRSPRCPSTLRRSGREQPDRTPQTSRSRCLLLALRLPESRRLPQPPPRGSP